MPLVRKSTVQALRLTLQGRVQGFGVRPAIARLARELSLTGSVANDARGVVVHVEGGPTSLRQFADRLLESLPPGTVVDDVATDDVIPTGPTQFEIDSSRSEGSLRAVVPPDLATCPECLVEVQTAGNRRYEYPFTTCTECGPRYSLIDHMPYDRDATGMASFALCAVCRHEYTDAGDRRFHSQTNACPECGPQLSLVDRSGATIGRGAEAVEQAVASLRHGKIVALRGIGGYQLLVDATSEAAVEALRRRKMRFGKPLAVMVPDIKAATQIAVIDQHARQALASPANPIVVVRQLPSSGLAAGVAPDLDTVGVMLPTTPLHHLLVTRVGRPLVVTSGNLEGDPLEYDPRRSNSTLPSLADVGLDHDRPILRPIDDSVVRIIDGHWATFRLARGLAPLPLELDARVPIIALGGHQKVAIALSTGAQALLGPHIGDLDSEAARVRYGEQVEGLCRLYGMEPTLVVHDLYPDYFTTRWATLQNLPTMAVQHHHAHIVAGMLEHKLLDRQVLGIAWDGTGYGPDSTIWGGEFLLATATDFERVGSLRPYALVGGDAAVRHPWRIAVALVCDACGAEAAARLRFPGVSVRDIERLLPLLTNTNLTVPTTSAGRLFDGVAALVLGLADSQFEGQPAMRLEALCDPSARGEYRLPLRMTPLLELDWRPLVAGVLDDLRAGIPAAAVAMKFHRSLAAAIAMVAERFPHLPAVLSGGCFQNGILTQLVAERLASRGQAVATPGVIPVNDGGLAAGQLAVAIARCQQKYQPCA